MTDTIAETVGRAAERLAARMLRGAQRVVLAGGPRTGKSTLAETTLGEVIGALTGARVYATDNLIGSHDWSAASAECARWMAETPGPWIVEGVTAVRGLRKWLDANPTGRPCELVIWMSVPVVGRSPGQETMAKGCTTIWMGKDGHEGVLARLLDRGVMVEED
jgi:hypothetical protein